MDKVLFVGSIGASAIAGVFGSLYGLVASPLTQLIPENSGDKRLFVYAAQAGIIALNVVICSTVFYNNVGNTDLFSVAKLVTASFVGCFNVPLLFGPLTRIK